MTFGLVTLVLLNSYLYLLTVIALGPDLSRGFRALKVWFSLRTFGTEALGAAILHTCQMATLLRDQVLYHSPELQLLAPVALNIVCFRFVDSTKVRAAVVVNL